MKRIISLLSIAILILGMVSCDKAQDSDDFSSELNVNHEYVDLGLSVMWATTNIGAEKPEDYGKYFAWGETKTKTTYNWSTYKYCNGTAQTLTKYNFKSEYGIVDSIATLELDDDVAHIRWGGKWRMPTYTECKELIDSCTCVWTDLNGVNGYKFTSNIRGYEDRSIFLPASGHIYGNESFNVGSWAYYPSSSLSGPDMSSTIHFKEDRERPNIFVGYRYCGFPVRPVCP